MRAGAEEAIKIQAQILLGDRPIEITFKRTWARLSRYEKVKIFGAIVYVLVFGTKISAEDVEKLKNGDMLTEMMEEMAAKFPGTLETIVHERDLYLTGSLRDCPGRIVVGVVGLGHLSGIEEHWEEEINRESLLLLPQPVANSRIARLFGWGLLSTLAVVCGIGIRHFFLS